MSLDDLYVTNSETFYGILGFLMVALALTLGALGGISCWLNCSGDERLAVKSPLRRRFEEKEV